MFKISQQQYAKISCILVAHMCALIGERTPLPDATSIVDNKVIRDVAILLPAMPAVYGIDLSGYGILNPRNALPPPLMMNRDTVEVPALTQKPNARGVGCPRVTPHQGKWTVKKREIKRSLNRLDGRPPRPLCAGAENRDRRHGFREKAAPSLFSAYPFRL